MLKNAGGGATGRIGELGVGWGSWGAGGGPRGAGGELGEWVGSWGAGGGARGAGGELGEWVEEKAQRGLSFPGGSSGGHLSLQLQ